jgi:hypothetical protein
MHNTIFFLQKFQASWKRQYVKSTSSRIVDFRECIQLANIKKQAFPLVDVPTRWESTYLMLRSAVPYQEAFNTLSMQDANFKTCPTPDKWEEISTMREFLAAFFKGKPSFSCLCVSLQLLMQLCLLSYTKTWNDPISDCTLDL